MYCRRETNSNNELEGEIMKVVNKNIVVTGGENGVGRELALKLLSKGARVVAIDINQSELQETFEISGKNKKLLTRVADILKFKGNL
jgi:NAD(P)-dependent dehydrogenase (short-subunit alcohol dehydrogenase family)